MKESKCDAPIKVTVPWKWLGFVESFESLVSTCEIFNNVYSILAIIQNMFAKYMYNTALLFCI